MNGSSYAEWRNNTTTRICLLPLIRLFCAKHISSSERFCFKVSMHVPWLVSSRNRKWIQSLDLWERIRRWWVWALQQKAAPGILDRRRHVDFLVGILQNQSSALKGTSTLFNMSVQFCSVQGWVNLFFLHTEQRYYVSSLSKEGRDFEINSAKDPKVARVGLF